MLMPKKKKNSQNRGAYLVFGGEEKKGSAQYTIIDLAFFGQRPCVINVIYHSLADDMLFSSMRSVVFKFSIKLCFGHCFGRKVFRYFPFLIASQLGTTFKLIFKAKEIADSFIKKISTSAAVIFDS